MVDLTDDHLVQRFKRGDESALALLDQKYRKNIIQSLTHLVPWEVAEDLYQESLLKATQKIHTFQNGNFGGWLYRITRNRCIDYLRQHGPFDGEDGITEPANQPADRQNDPAYQLEAQEIQEKIDREIAALPTRQKLVARLRLYDNLKFAQIAETIGGNAKTAKALFHYAQRRLQQRLSLYLAAIGMPINSFLTLVSKPVMTLSIIAMTTFMASDVPKMRPLQLYSRSHPRLAETSAVRQSPLQPKETPPPAQVTLEAAVEGKDFPPPSVAPVPSPPPRSVTETAHDEGEAMPEGLELPKSTQRFNSPIENRRSSILNSPSKLVTTTDAIPRLHLEADRRP